MFIQIYDNLDAILDYKTSDPRLGSDLCQQFGLKNNEEAAGLWTWLELFFKEASGKFSQIKTTDAWKNF